MNVIAATGQQALDRLIQQLTKTPISPVAYKEGVVKVSARDQPVVVVLSAFLSGQTATEDVLYQLRKQGARVIMLIGHTQAKVIREKWIPLGVYDLIMDPVTEEKLHFALMHPATLGAAEESLHMMETGKELNQTGKDKAFSSLQQRRKPTRQIISETKHAASSDVSNQRGDIEVAKQEAWDFDPPNSLPVSTKHHEKEKCPPASTRTKTQDGGKQRKPAREKPNKDQGSQTDVKRETWDVPMLMSTRQEALPSSAYNIVVLSPVSAGKTYVAMNIAAVLSKQGLQTELVASHEYGDIWTYLDLPLMKRGSPKGLPNLTVTTHANMADDPYYRVIDLPYEHWQEAQEWQDALFLYVQDMDIMHRQQAQHAIAQWQGRSLLHILNRFVPNVLDTGQEQKIRMTADIVFSDQPAHFLAMRFGRPVAMTEQSAAREFEMAVKTVCEALPASGQRKITPMS